MKVSALPPKNRPRVKFKIAQFHLGPLSGTQYTQFPLISLVVEGTPGLETKDYPPSFVIFLLICKIQVHGSFVFLLPWFFAVVWGASLHVAKSVENPLQNWVLCVEFFHLPAYFHHKLALSFFDIILLHLGLFCPFQYFCYSESSGVFLLSIQDSDLSVKEEEEAQLLTRCFFPQCLLALFQSPPEQFWQTTRRHVYPSYWGGEATNQVSHVL